jgi:IS4 transposase
MGISAEEICLIYKKRWGIELLFKKMKQNFQRIPTVSYTIAE